MAHGENNRGFSGYYVNIKNLKKDSEGDPYFLLRDTKTKEEETSQFISGTLEYIRFVDKEWENKKFKEIRIMIADVDVKYLISTRFTHVGRNILNSILKAQDITKDIKINLYTNKNGYKSVGVTQVNLEGKDEWTGVLYTKEETDPLVQSFETENGNVKVYTNLNNKLIEDINTLIVPKLPRSFNEENTDEESEHENSDTNSDTGGAIHPEDVDDGLPF